MFYKCSSRPERDLGKTIQGLGVDLFEMTSTGRIPSSSSEVIYNQLDDFSNVGFRINDDFDFMRYLSRVSQFSSSLSGSGNTPAGSTGASQQQDQ